jgi:hypothetical protein
LESFFEQSLTFLTKKTKVFGELYHPSLTIRHLQRRRAGYVQGHDPLVCGLYRGTRDWKSFFVVTGYGVRDGAEETVVIFVERHFQTFLNPLYASVNVFRRERKYKRGGSERSQRSRLLKSFVFCVAVFA